MIVAMSTDLCPTASVAQRTLRRPLVDDSVSKESRDLQLLTTGVGLFGVVGIAQPLTAAAVAAAERRSASEHAADQEIVPARKRWPKVRVETVPAEHV